MHLVMLLFPKGLQGQSRKYLLMSEWLIEVYLGAVGLAELEQPWQHLYEQQEEPLFCHAYEWVSSVLLGMGKKANDLLFVTLSWNGEVLAILPLRQSKARIMGLPMQVLTLGPVPNPAWQADILLRRDPILEECLPDLLADLAQHPLVNGRLLIFPIVPEFSNTAWLLRDSKAELVYNAEQGKGTHIPRNTHDDLRKGMSKKRRYYIKKIQRDLAQRDDVVLEESLDSKDRPALFEEFVAVEASGWKGAKGSRSSLAFRPEAYLAFKHMSERTWRHSRFQLHILKISQEVVAGTISLIVGQRFCLLKIAYNPAYARLSPGHVLLDMVLQQFTSQNPIRAVDFMSYTPWIHSWHPQSYQCHHYAAVVPGRGALFLFFLYRMDSWLWRLYRLHIKPHLDLGQYLERLKSGNKN